jgi:hypothetical protein
MAGTAPKEADVSGDLTDRPVDPGLLPERGLGCSVGITAHNEEANIAAAIGAILGHKLASSHITELIVVASGCEDRTAPIVADIARKDPRVRLIEQECREGKASAINLFISAARSPILLMVRADTRARHFHDPAVGVTDRALEPVWNARLRRCAPAWQARHRRRQTCQGT